LSWSDPGWRIAEAVRLGWREFRAHNPAHIVLTTLVPRAVLQCVFFALLGRSLGGRASAEFAFVGSLGAIITLTTIVAVCEVPMADKQSGTFYRIRSGLVPPALVFVARAVPYPLVGFCCAVLSLVIGAPLVGLARDIPRIVPALPLYAVMAVTTTAAGLAVGALAVGKRADVMLGNSLAYLILLAGGVVLPAGRVVWIDWLGVLLPLRHGLDAVRAMLSGQPWLPSTALEVAVGAGWGLLAFLIVGVQTRRARVSGFDDFE
jgi:ABC-2 type transport system permease protein